jgi:uncharacterized protein YfbU (UPF0304 family)
MGGPPVKLLDRVRNRIRVKGYSIRTEQSYVSWIRRFILFHNKRHPQWEKMRSRLTSLTWQSPAMFPHRSEMKKHRHEPHQTVACVDSPVLFPTGKFPM